MTYRNVSTALKPHGVMPDVREQRVRDELRLHFQPSAKVTVREIVRRLSATAAALDKAESAQDRQRVTAALSELPLIAEQAKGVTLNG